MSGGRVHFTGVLSGSGNFAVASGIQARILAICTYTGSTTVNTTGAQLYVGTIPIDGLTGSIAATSGIDVGAGSHLYLYGTAAGQTHTYAGAISGSGTVDIGGSATGTLILSGTNTNTGAWSIDSNVVRVTGSIAAGSTLAVGNSAGQGILSGDGTVSKTIELYSGGKIAPGSAGIGTLNTAGITTYTGAIDVELDGTTPTFDKINSTGTIALSSNANALTVTSIANSSIGDVYTILEASTAITGTFSGKANGSSFMVSGRKLKITYNAKTVTLEDIDPAPPAGSLMMPFFN